MPGQIVHTQATAAVIIDVKVVTLIHLIELS